MDSARRRLLQRMRQATKGPSVVRFVQSVRGGKLCRANLQMRPRAISVLNWLPSFRMAAANRRCHPYASARCHQNADPDDGSADGRVGGTDQITELVIGNTIEAAVHLQL